MAELRWHPLIKDWVIVASHRQDRPHMPKDWCPFCPGSGKVPDDFDVMMYPNDFPAMSQQPTPPDDIETSFFKAKPAYGKCEVILYSPKHQATLAQLSEPHVEKLVELWTQRFIEIKKDEKIQYVFIFENRGEEVGVTMPHPHGQIYGYSFIPKKIALELESCKEHFLEHERCLICDMNQNEKAFEKRIIFENDHFMVYLPFFVEYPYGVYIVAKRHVTDLSVFTKQEKQSFAKALRDTVGMFDGLFDRPFPYMMCMHQTPVNTKEDHDAYYHFHVEFFPPLRSENKIKYNASSETGVWAHCNTTAPEDMAKELKKAHQKYIDRG